MVKFHPSESFTFESCVRVMDLVKVVNQLYQDQMQYAKLSFSYCEDEDHYGEVKIYAIPSATSDDVKQYPTLTHVSSIVIDTDCLD